jgi:hypothetical protein
VISYRITHAKLLAKIRALDAGWIAKAAAATAACVAAGRYVKENAQGKEIDGLWGDIKEVFIQLQHGKCCYCERLLESPAYGKIEHDVEHYRPKSRLKNWFTPEVKRDFPDWPPALRQSGAKDKGYHRLAFDPRNYATSCKTCNSALKSDYFPVASTPRLETASPAGAKGEMPFLILPVGTGDQSADSLIQFDGILAQPVHEADDDLFRHWRARVTIRFFRLNRSAPDGEAAPGQEGRENLYRDRAERITALADCLDAIETSANAAVRKLREDKVKRLVADASPHANCCRSFLRLWATPATRAQAVNSWLDAEKYLQSQSA